MVGRILRGACDAGEDANEEESDGRHAGTDDCGADLNCAPVA